MDDAEFILWLEFFKLYCASGMLPEIASSVANRAAAIVTAKKGGAVNADP